MPTSQPHEQYDVIIIGAGISGIAMACQLKEKLNLSRFIIFEKQDGIGGIWQSHQYPGVACDVPAPLYSYRFAPNQSWSTLTPSGREILEYLEGVCAKYNIMENIQFNTSVTALQWKDESGTAEWEVESIQKNGMRSLTRSKIVIAAAGKFNIPRLSPLIKTPGLASFTGQILHTARWDPAVSLDHKNVLVVGSGCAAAQLLPALLKHSPCIKSITQLIRSPPWVSPRFLSPTGLLSEKHILGLLRHVPGLAGIVRMVMLAFLESEYFRFYGSRSNWFSRIWRWWRERLFLGFMRRSVAREYWGILEPGYQVGCKRVVQDSGWFGCLADGRVRLVTGGIKRVECDVVVLGSDSDDAGGEEGTRECRIPTDVIILATGYETDTLLDSISIAGRDSIALQEIWKERGGPQAYLGIAMDHFPNLFFVSGPNSSVGHTTVLIGIEHSVSYIVKLIGNVLDGRASTVEVKEEACRRWTEMVQDASRESVWIAGGCRNWYVDGRRWNSMIYPFSQIYAIYTYAFPRWEDWTVNQTHTSGMGSIRKLLNIGALLLGTVLIMIYISQ
ncbi:hypothetical protein BJX99DRAFT_171327 [Aspergillus californicus]